MEERVPMKERLQEKVSQRLDHVIEPDTMAFIELYSRKGWMFSCFSLFFLAVPVYLVKSAVTTFSAFSVFDLFLSLVLLLEWAGLPALFVFHNSKDDRNKRIYAWGWIVFAAAFCVIWAIVLPV